MVIVTPIIDRRADRAGDGTRSSEHHVLAMAVLCLLFVIMLVEPLACGRYCQTGTQLGAHSLFAAQRQPHELAPHNGIAAELANFRPVLLPNLFVCFTDAQDGFPSNLPNRLVTVEQHDHQATTVAIVLLILILAILQHLNPLPHPALRGVLHSLLRPPIAPTA